MKVRNFKIEDWPIVEAWWKKRNELIVPPLEAFPLRTTFIVEYKTTPLLCISLIMTNSSYFCIANYLMSDPECAPELRHAAVALISEFIQGVARSSGYKRITIQTPYENLVKRYEKLGYSRRETSHNMDIAL